MQGAIYNVTGLRFGRLTVLGIADRRGGQVTWRCQCDCGAVVTVVHRALITGQTQHCTPTAAGPPAERPADEPASRGRPPRVAWSSRRQALAHELAWSSRRQALAHELARVMAHEGAPAATEYHWRAKHSDIVAAALAVAEERTAARVAA